MSVSDLISRALATNEHGVVDLHAKECSDAIQDIAGLYVRDMRLANQSEKGQAIAYKYIGKKLRIECEKNPFFSEQLFERLKDDVFGAIQKKVVKSPSRVKFTISRKRIIDSSESQSQSDDEASETQSASKDSSASHSRQPGQKRSKRKYATYDQDFKEQVCLYTNQYGPEQSAEKYQLSLRKVVNWYEAHQMNLLGRGRKALDPIMEFNLCIWIMRKIWNQVPLTQRIIRQKAATLKTLSKQFNGSKGWLEKFFLRHVELKSCFDTRGKPELRAECARYHRCAFARLEKDSDSLLRVGENMDKIVQGDLTQIIYFNKDHPLLKFKQDRILDKAARGAGPFYNYSDLNNIVVPKAEQKVEQSSEQSEEQTSKLCKVNQQSEQDDQDSLIKEDESMASSESRSVSYEQSSVDAVGKKEEDSSPSYDLYEQDEPSSQSNSYPQNKQCDSEDSDEPKIKQETNSKHIITKDQEAQQIQ